MSYVKIGWSSFNVEAVKEMGFEAFKASHSHLSDHENLYYQITGEDVKAKTSKTSTRKSSKSKPESDSESDHKQA